MSVTNYNLNKSAEEMLGPSIVKILQDKLGIESQRTERKHTNCGRKTTRGNSTESLEGPCSSEINLTAVFDSKEEVQADFLVDHIKKETVEK